MSPLYWEIGKQLALQLVAAYATTKPGVAVSLSVLDNILKAQAAIVIHNAVIVRAQSEGWSDDDPRWEVALAEQQARMDVENKRHDERG